MHAAVFVFSISKTIIGLRQRRNAEKTAEERFNMLARGWLAYPVTPIHPQLPPFGGCLSHRLPTPTRRIHSDAARFFDGKQL